MAVLIYQSEAPIIDQSGFDLKKQPQAHVPSVWASMTLWPVCWILIVPVFNTNEGSFLSINNINLPLTIPDKPNIRIPQVPILRKVSTLNQIP